MKKVITTFILATVAVACIVLALVIISMEPARLNASLAGFYISKTVLSLMVLGVTVSASFGIVGILKEQDDV